MRLGVLDVGSHTACLAVVDAAAGRLVPVGTVKTRLRLAERLGPGGRLDRAAVDAVAGAVVRARAEAERLGVREWLGYATALVRDAPNATKALEEIRSRTGVRLAVMPGETEAELTFLAARRWMGGRAGTLALLDIGGSTLEVALGAGEVPDYAVSLSLGAGLLTREHLGAQDPPPGRAVATLRRHVRAELAETAEHLRRVKPDTIVAASRTFQQLARLCGAAPERDGPFVPRHLSRADLRPAVKRLVTPPAVQRATWPGISAVRARQSAAGAVVAHMAMKLMDIEQIVISPWALREGVLLRHLEGGTPHWWRVLVPGTGSGRHGSGRPDSLGLAAAG